MRRKAKIDSNQETIARALEKEGALVERRLARIGEGVPDLLVCYKNIWYVFEVKGLKEPLTEREKKWHEKFKNAYVVRTVQDALSIIKGAKNE